MLLNYYELITILRIHGFLFENKICSHALPKFNISKNQSRKN